jgi:hypothetical protein
MMGAFYVSRQDIRDITRSTGMDAELYLALTGAGLGVGAALIASLQYD